jgi:murein L,D-transpeptidase YafK
MNTARPVHAILRLAVVASAATALAVLVPRSIAAQASGPSTQPPAASTSKKATLPIIAMMPQRFTPADVRLIRRAFAAVDSLLIAYEPPEDTAVEPEPGESRLLGVPVASGAKPDQGDPKLLGVPVANSKEGQPTELASKPARSKPLTFKQAQQSNQRVLEAQLEKKFELKKLFRDQGLAYPAAETFLRIFKRERELEVWVRQKDMSKFVMLKKYSICAMSGQLGPKRTEGDGQTPEGFYYIDGFNPSSEFHLSLHLDYPNRSDQMLNPGANLGGNIFIHGGCRTEGCLAVTDDAIKELYWLSVEARNAGQKRIPVHIFPARLNDDELYRLTQVFTENAYLKRFWANLKPAYDFFETKRELPPVRVDERGRYRITPAPVLATDSAAPVKPKSGG